MASSEILQVVFGAAAGTITIGGLVAFFMGYYLRDRSRSRYDESKHRAVLSEVRDAYEAQMARITSQLVATEERWREANHLLLSGQARQAQENGDVVADTGFVQSLGLDPVSIKVDDNLVFMLTPFSKEEMATFRVVQKVCQDNGMICVRGDETQVSGDILPHIVEMMLRAKIVVANITSRNPNVLYELGIAHAFNKQTILLSRTLESAPFDIQSRRIVTYASMPDLESKLTGALLRAYRQRQ